MGILKTVRVCHKVHREDNYGFVTSYDDGREVYSRHKWRSINQNKSLPRVISEPTTTEKELTSDFWDHFEQIADAEYNVIEFMDYKKVG